jgi:hypothetical protein
LFGFLWIFKKRIVKWHYGTLTDSKTILRLSDSPTKLFLGRCYERNEAYQIKQKTKTEKSERKEKRKAPKER